NCCKWWDLADLLSFLSFVMEDFIVSFHLSSCLFLLPGVYVSGCQLLKQDRTVNVFYTFFPSNSEAGHGDVVWSRDGRPIAYRSGR
ncbi:hypothetical protein BBA14_001235, partial [Escherichia coli]